MYVCTYIYIYIYIYTLYIYIYICNVCMYVCMYNLGPALYSCMYACIYNTRVCLFYSCFVPDLHASLIYFDARKLYICVCMHVCMYGRLTELASNMTQAATYTHTCIRTNIHTYSRLQCLKSRL